MLHWRKGLLIGAVAIVGVVSTAACTVEEPAKAGKSDDAAAKAAVKDVMTASMVVDVMGGAQARKFCKAYNVVGDAGYPTFRSSYGKAVYGVSAREVFDELASRC